MHIKKLPPALIIAFYKDILVQPGTIKASVQNPNKIQKSGTYQEKINDNPSAIHFLGENKQQVTIIVHTPDYPYLPDNELELLTKMIGACNLRLDDIALINEHNSTASWEDVQQQLKPRITLFFGSKTWQQQLPFTIPFYQAQPHGLQLFLTAPALQSLTAITDDVKAEKLKLWAALQKIFRKKL